MFNLQETNNERESKTVSRLLGHLADVSLLTPPFKNAPLYIHVSLSSIHTYPNGVQARDVCIRSTLSRTDFAPDFWAITLRFESDNPYEALTNVEIIGLRAEHALTINCIDSLFNPQNKPRTIKKRLQRAFWNFVNEHKEAAK